MAVGFPTGAVGRAIRASGDAIGAVGEAIWTPSPGGRDVRATCPKPRPTLSMYTNQFRMLAMSIGRIATVARRNERSMRNFEPDLKQIYNALEGRKSQ